MVKYRKSEIMIKQEKVSIYQPDQEGRIFPEEPRFDTHEEHRQHLKVHLARRADSFTSVVLISVLLGT